MKKYLLILFVLFSLELSAQEKMTITEEDYDNKNVEMADTMRSNGKIFVVVTVISVLMAGFFFYVLYIDRKVSRLENELENNTISKLKDVD